MVAMLPLEAARTLLRVTVSVRRGGCDRLNARVRRYFIRKFLEPDIARSAGTDFRPDRLIAADRHLADYFAWLHSLHGPHAGPSCAKASGRASALRGIANSEASVAHKVLILTGGLITSQESSMWQAVRKCWRSTRACDAWLDLKIKLAMAEPLLARGCEQFQLARRPAEVRQAVEDYFAQPVETATPPLTEVVLATLLEEAGLAFECLSLDVLFTDPAHAERLLTETSCVFLSTTYLHDLSELEAVVQRVKRPHNRVVAGGCAGRRPRAAMARHAGRRSRGRGLWRNARGRHRPLAQQRRPGTPRAGGRPGRSTRHSPFLYSGVPAGRSLDDLVLPDWRLAERVHGLCFRMIYYESVRGCPYRCNFCNYPYLFDDAVSHQEARRMADDWTHYVDTLGVEYVTCLDSLFTIPRSACWSSAGCCASAACR